MKKITDIRYIEGVVALKNTCYIDTHVDVPRQRGYEVCGNPCNCIHT